MAEASRTEPDSPNAAELRPSGFTSFAQRRPITAFLVGALGIGLPLLMIPAIAGIPLMPFLLPMTYIAFLGSALVVTRLTDGPGGVRQLLSRLLIWRFSVARWAVIVFAMPVLVVALAAVSGTLEGPEGGWESVVGDSLLFTFISGLLLINLWEETAWSGFMQSRMMERHGLLVASLLTALPVAVYRVPLSFEGIGRGLRPGAASPSSSGSRPSIATCSGCTSSTPAGACWPSASTTPPGTRRRASASSPVSGNPARRSCC